MQIIKGSVLGNPRISRMPSIQAAKTELSWFVDEGIPKKVISESVLNRVMSSLGGAW